MSDTAQGARLLEDAGVRRAVEAAASFVGTPAEVTRSPHGRCAWRGELPAPESIEIDLHAGRLRVVRWCPASDDENTRDRLVTLPYQRIVQGYPADGPRPEPGDLIRWELDENFGHAALTHSLLLAPLFAPGADEATRRGLDELRAPLRPDLDGGTIGQAAFDGLLMAAPGGIVMHRDATGAERRWRWLTVLPGPYREDAWQWALWIDVVRDGAVSHEFHTRPCSPPVRAQLHPGWRERLAALASGPRADDEIETIVAALTAPPRPDSLAHWYRTRALPVLLGPAVDRDGPGLAGADGRVVERMAWHQARGDAGPEVNVSVRGTGEVTSVRTPGGATRTLYAEHLPPATPGEDRMRLVLLTRPVDEPSERIEQLEIAAWPFQPGVEAEYEPLPASADEAAALAQLERFREAIAVSLSSADPPGFALTLDEVLRTIPLPHLLFEALREGPPPSHPPMNGTLGEHARASARSLRPVEGAELDELRWRYGRGGRRPDIEEASSALRARFNRGRPARRPPRRPPPADIVAAFAVGGWTLLFSLDLGQCEGFFEDSVHLVRDGQAHLLLVTDPWDPIYPFSVDGDDATWRLVATWLAHALRDRGLDVPLRKVDDGEDEDSDEQPLSDWVLGKGHEPRIVLDWRLAGRILRVVPYTEWQLAVLSDEVRGPGAVAARAAYHAFVRDVIDPGFVPPLTAS